MSILETIRFALQTARLAQPPRWSAARRERLTQRRLRRLVRFARERSSFYNRKLAALPQRGFSLADLPISTKDEIREHFDEVVTDRRIRRDDVERFLADRANIGHWFLDQYAVSHTSGSQGAALLIVQDRRALSILFSIMSARANRRRRPGVVEGIRRWRSPVRVAIVAQHRGFYPSAAAFEFMERLTRPFTRVAWFSATDPELVAGLNDFQPQSLVGYASVLEGLALEPRGLQLRTLEQIGNSSEQLTARARERIERSFGVPVLDHYGAGECLLLSDGCPTDGGAHVNADWAILEVVDEQYRPVAPGQTGHRVLVTNLANYVQPFIRYELHDRLAMASEPCGCGSHLPRIARIEGRSGEAFWYRDQQGRLNILPGVLFHSAIDTIGNVREWRAIQTERNRVELQLELLSAESVLDEQELLRQLRAFGLPREVSVTIEPASGLRPNPETGKFRRMISQVSQPAGLEAEASDPALIQREAPRILAAH